MADEGKVPLYDSFSVEYDAMVSWPGRLKREAPLLEESLREVQAKRVLDVGSGTGWHAIHLARQGFEVVGVDPSLEMVRRAEANAKGVSGVRFVQAGLGSLRKAVGDGFDGVLCLGNTLPHILTQDGLLQSLQDMAAVLRPGGVLVLQQLNYDRILVQGQRFLGLTPGRLDGKEYLFFRFYDYRDRLLVFNVVIMERQVDGSWTHRVESTQLQAIISSQLRETLAVAGFARPEVYGNYERDAFNPLSAGDLIVVARRTADG
ncbi:MAG: class I SAM-dependent methyltransferase [Chloroflexota bacterium]